MLALLLITLAGCGSGQFLLPPRSGGNAAARQYQQAVEQHYRVSQRNLEAAVTAEELAIAHDPSWAPAYSRLAELFLSLGQPAAALATARKATMVAPRTALYQTNLGKLAKSLGRAKLAAQAFSRAIRLNPASWASMDGLAGLSLSQGRYRVAVRWLERALAAGGPEALTWQEWGQVAEAQGNWPLAGRYYREAQAAAPSWWRPHYDLAELAMHRGQIGRARRELRIALVTNPGSSQAWLLLQSLPAGLAHWRAQQSGQYPVDGSKTP